MHHLITFSQLLAAVASLASAHPTSHRHAARATAPTRTMIPSTCFSSQSAFDTDFAYNYPWGTTHNGAARMDTAHVSLAGNQLTLTAEYVTGQPDATFSNEPLKINYLSGTVHAKETFTVAKTGGYDFSAQVKAPVGKGTWPAFWLTAVEGWPPEIDMAEWKGSGKISFNTFNTSSVVAADDVAYPSPDTWHDIKTEIRDENGKDVSIAFYLDGKLQTVQYGPEYVGKSMYFIINLQMEGSSGSPGPMGKTTYSVRNLEVLSYNP